MVSGSGRSGSGHLAPTKCRRSRVLLAAKYFRIFEAPRLWWLDEPTLLSAPRKGDLPALPLQPQPHSPHSTCVLHQLDSAPCFSSALRATYFRQHHHSRLKLHTSPHGRQPVLEHSYQCRSRTPSVLSFSLQNFQRLSHKQTQIYGESDAALRWLEGFIDSTVLDHPAPVLDRQSVQLLQVSRKRRQRLSQPHPFRDELLDQTRPSSDERRSQPVPRPFCCTASL